MIGRVVEPVSHHTNLLLRGEVEIARNFGQPARAAPAFGCPSQSLGRVSIIGAFKIVKIPAFKVVQPIGCAMFMGGETAQCFTIPMGGHIG